MTERLDIIGVTPQETRYDLVGVDALPGSFRSDASAETEVRLRVVVRTAWMAHAVHVGPAVEALLTNGPAERAVRTWSMLP